MLNKITLVLTFVMSFGAFAKDFGPGNGGDAVYLTNDEVMLLDFAEDPQWETQLKDVLKKLAADPRVEYRKIQNEPAYATEFQAVLNRLASKLPSLADDLANRAEKIRWGFLAGADLPELEDEGSLSPSVLKKQLAIQFDDTVLVNLTVYDQLKDDRQKAGLFVHEILIYIAKQTAYVHSPLIRKGVRYVFPSKDGASAEIESATESGAYEFFKSVLPGHELVTASHREWERTLKEIRDVITPYLDEQFKGVEHERAYLEIYAFNLLRGVKSVYEESGLPKRDLRPLNSLVVEFLDYTSGLNTFISRVVHGIEACRVVEPQAWSAAEDLAVAYLSRESKLSRDQVLSDPQAPLIGKRFLGKLTDQLIELASENGTVKFQNRADLKGSISIHCAVDFFGFTTVPTLKCLTKALGVNAVRK